MLIKFNKKGFTILEILIVIILIMSALGFTILYTQTFQLRADLNNQAATIVSYLRLAQSNAISGRLEDFTSIHLQDSSYTLFSGDIYNPGNSRNTTFELPKTISIKNISLNSDGNDLIFSAPNGETAAYGNFDLSSNEINKTITINISPIGSISY